jgi:hypothetical protein
VSRKQTTMKDGNSIIESFEMVVYLEMAGD